MQQQFCFNVEICLHKTLKKKIEKNSDKCISLKKNPLLWSIYICISKITNANEGAFSREFFTEILDYSSDHLLNIKILFTGKYECWCPRHSTGVNCEIYDLNVTPGIGKPTVVPPVIDPQQVQCVTQGCSTKAKDGKCDVGLLKFKSYMIQKYRNMTNLLFIFNVDPIFSFLYF